MGARARNVGDVLAAVGIVAAIMMLVRPGSKGPALVVALGHAFESSAAGTIGAQLDGSKPAPPTPRSSSPSGSSSGSGSSGSGSGSGVPTLNPFQGIIPNPLNLPRGPLTGIPGLPV
jgi:hypothetical protein